MKKSLRRKSFNTLGDYFIAKVDAEGNPITWTLPALLGDMLALAESLYGKRTLEYTCLGIEFAQGGPVCWQQKDQPYIIIELGMYALDNYYEAMRELAHECIHLLSPTGKKDANVLEEGLAVHFERLYMRQSFGPGGPWDDDEPQSEYSEAFSQMEALLRIEPDAIKLLRSEEPIITRISCDLILKICPSVPVELARTITQPFY